MCECTFSIAGQARQMKKSFFSMKKWKKNSSEKLKWKFLPNVLFLEKKIFSNEKNSFVSLPVPVCDCDCMPTHDCARTHGGVRRLICNILFTYYIIIYNIYNINITCIVYIYIYLLDNSPGLGLPPPLPQSEHERRREKTRSIKQVKLVLKTNDDDERCKKTRICGVKPVSQRCKIGLKNKWWRWALCRKTVWPVKRPGRKGVHGQLQTAGAISTTI